MSRRVWIPIGTALTAVAIGVVTNVFSALLPAWLSDLRVLVPVFIVLVLLAVIFALAGDRQPAISEPSAASQAVSIPCRPAGLGSLRPPSVDPGLVRGRDVELARLWERLGESGGRFVVVAAAGGWGKTTLAAALAARAEAAGCAVFWLRWRDAEILADQFLEVAVACGLRESEAAEVRARGGSLPDLVWRQLGQVPGWLIVVDNADQPAALSPGEDPVGDYRGWVRPTGRGLLLVTSRDRNSRTWGGRVVIECLGPLEAQAGGRVLTDLAAHAGDQEQAAALAGRLGGLPLALCAAGSYLAE